ncbi:MAG: sugar phosphate isomerase/epimerase [Oscillospiraceae bacterium]|nr:sugar phosphate isomerase/epimerase [Oscillospiraceae bacterium]
MHDLKFACADFTFPLLSHDGALKLISIMGFDGVDIGMFEQRSHLQPSNQFGALSKNARMLREKTEALGLFVADVFLQTATDFREYASNHPDRARRGKMREIFSQCLEYTAECGCRHMSGLPGVYFDELGTEGSYRLCCEELAYRRDAAESFGVTFSVEAHIGSIVPCPESALQLTKDVPKLTLTLDFTHFIRAGTETFRALPLVEKASHFHARGAAPGRLQTVFAENTVDYAAIAKEMKKTGYDKSIGVEYTWQEWENCNRVDNVSESVLMKNYLKKLLSEGV